MEHGNWKTLKIEIPIEPKAQARSRAVSHGRKSWVMDDPKSKAYKEELARLIKQHMDREGLRPTVAPVRVYIGFSFAHTKSMSKKDRESMPLVKAVKPDLDNLIKPVKDAMNGIVYQDDSRIIYLEAGKYISDLDMIIIRVDTTYHDINCEDSYNMQRESDGRPWLPTTHEIGEIDDTSQ